MHLENPSSKLIKKSLYISAVAPDFTWASGCFCFVFIVLFSFQGVASEESYERDVVLAAEAGDPQSQYALALFYEYGTETIDRNPDQAVLWLEKAGVAGVSGACLYLGLKYEYGNRVKKDLSKAACWYACAAHKDWPAAQYFLATMYENGKGVPQSSLIALAWFGLAAEYGYPGAENEVSRLLSITGYKDVAELRVAQQQLLQKDETPCN
jgi:Sel1 repeat